MSRPPRRGGAAWRWGIPALLLLLPAFLFPLGALVWRGIAPDGTPSSASILEVTRDPFLWDRLTFTIGQALSSTVLSVLVGLPAAYVVSRIRFRGRGLVRAAITMPLVLPTIVVALAFQRLFEPGGWFDEAVQAAGGPEVRLLGTLWPILLAHAFLSTAIVVRMVGTAWAGLDPRQAEAARLLGANRRRTFTAVTLPALLPTIGAAAALVFVFTFTSFGVVLVLGTPLYETLEVTTFRLAMQQATLSQAAVLSVVQIAVTTTALMLRAGFQRRRAVQGHLRPGWTRADHARPFAETTWHERMIALFALATLGPLLVLLIAALIGGAVTRDGVLTGDHFAALFGDDGSALDAIRWSAMFALGTLVIALAVGGAAGMATARSGGRATLLLSALCCCRSPYRPSSSDSRRSRRSTASGSTCAARRCSC